MTAVTAVAAAGSTLARVGDAVVAAVAPAVQAVAREPLPGKPPIGGPVWTIAVPALLLLVSIWGTWMLYRHFAGEE